MDLDHSGHVTGGSTGGGVPVTMEFDNYINASATGTMTPTAVTVSTGTAASRTLAERYEHISTELANIGTEYASIGGAGASTTSMTTSDMDGNGRTFLADLNHTVGEVESFVRDAMAFLGISGASTANVVSASTGASTMTVTFSMSTAASTGAAEGPHGPCGASAGACSCGSEASGAAGGGHGDHGAGATGGADGHGDHGAGATGAATGDGHGDHGAAGAGGGHGDHGTAGAGDGHGDHGGGEANGEGHHDMAAIAAQADADIAAGITGEYQLTYAQLDALAGAAGIDVDAFVAAYMSDTDFEDDLSPAERQAAAYQALEAAITMKLTPGLADLDQDTYAQVAGEMARLAQEGDLAGLGAMMEENGGSAADAAMMAQAIGSARNNHYAASGAMGQDLAMNAHTTYNADAGDMGFTTMHMWNLSLNNGDDTPLAGRGANGDRGNAQNGTVDVGAKAMRDMANRYAA